MNFQLDLMSHLIRRGHLEVVFKDPTVDISKLFELECCQALERIRCVLDDHTISDCDCFHQIEEILFIFESLGSSGGSRHDF